MAQKTERIAMLIDGDNAQAKLLKAILEEVAKYGKVTIRRIYGDWTKTNMNSWKDMLNELSFTPIQKFSYTTGKNSTDSAMIIDAMDILHSGVVDGFCIVSSDSDYTGLAKRIREQGVFVMGVGEKKTPMAFVQSCEVFTFSENIIKEPIIERQLKTPATRARSKIRSRDKQVGQAEIAADPVREPVPLTAPEQNRFSKVDLELVDKAYFMASPEESGLYVSTLGANLRKIDPSFDSRAHGFQTLTRLMRSLPEYEVIKSEQGGGITQSLVRRK